MKEYIQLLEKMADEIVRRVGGEKDEVMEIVRKYLNPFEPRPKDRFNPFNK